MLIHVRKRLSDRLQVAFDDCLLDHSFRSQRQIFYSRRWAIQVHGSIHLGRVKRPVRDSDHRFVGARLVQRLVEYLEWQMRRLLSQADLIKKHNNDSIRSLHLVAPSALERLLNPGACGEGAALVAERLHCWKGPQEVVAGRLPLQVRLDQLHRETLAGTWLPNHKDRDLIQSAHENHEDVLAQGFVQSDATRKLHAVDKAALHSVNCICDALRCQRQPRAKFLAGDVPPVRCRPRRDLHGHPSVSKRMTKQHSLLAWQSRMVTVSKTHYHSGPHMFTGFGVHRKEVRHCPVRLASRRRCCRKVLAKPSVHRYAPSNVP